MAANGIKGQCRRIFGLSCDLAVGNQSQFDESLEAVADTKSQSISLI